MNRHKEWIEAKKKFHLSDMHIQIAQELGMNPKKLVGLIITNKKDGSHPYQILSRNCISRGSKKKSQMSLRY
jgi:hypothetical protein